MIVSTEMDSKNVQLKLTYSSDERMSIEQCVFKNIKQKLKCMAMYMNIWTQNELACTH